MIQLSSQRCPRERSDAFLSCARTCVLVLDGDKEGMGKNPDYVEVMLSLFGRCTVGPIWVNDFWRIDLSRIIQ